MPRLRPTVALLASAGLLAVGTAVPAQAAVPSRWKNCTAVHQVYPHGVGKAHARDKTSGKPVTTFKRSDRLYATAIRYNKGLDRDKDGIACERR